MHPLIDRKPRSGIGCGPVAAVGRSRRQLELVARTVGVADAHEEVAFDTEYRTEGVAAAVGPVGAAQQGLDGDLLHAADERFGVSRPADREVHPRDVGHHVDHRTLTGHEVDRTAAVEQIHAIARSDRHGQHVTQAAVERIDVLEHDLYRVAAHLTGRNVDPIGREFVAFGGKRHGVVAIDHVVGGYLRRIGPDRHGDLLRGRLGQTRLDRLGISRRVALDQQVVGQNGRGDIELVIETMLLDILVLAAGKSDCGERRENQ